MSEPTTDTAELPADAIHAGKAANLLHAHVGTIHRWVLSGKLRGWRRGPGRRLFVSRAELLALVSVAVESEAGLMKAATRRVLERHGLA